MNVLYWNCRGYRSSFEDLKVLLYNHKPSVVCLQETFHGNATPFPPSRYSIFSANPVVQYADGVRPSRGLLTLIHNTVAFEPININTNLEAIAFRIKLRNPTTVCNIYIAPNENINQNELSLSLIHI